jgi:hypothetical protein
MQLDAHQGESSGSIAKKATSVDLIFDLIDEYRKKKQGDKGPKLTTFLTMLTERQIRMLNTMGMRYVRSEALKTAYDVVHEDRVKKYGPGVEIPFNRDEMPTFKYDAAAFLVGKLQADADEKALEAAVAGLRGNPAGRIELARWDDRVIAEIKKEFLIVDPSKIHEMLRLITLPSLSKSNLLATMIEFTGDVLATKEKTNLSGMSAEGQERILKDQNKKIDAEAHNIAELIKEATEEKTPGMPLDEWAEAVMTVTREALKIGSLDDLAGDGSQERIGELEKENERLRALIARGAPARPATERPQTFCTSCDKWGYHSTAQCDPGRARQQTAAPTGKGGKGLGGGKGDGKGKGSDQTLYNAQGEVVWRSQKDQAAWKEKQQQKKN